MKKNKPVISPVTRKLSTYIAGVAKRPLPARVTERAKLIL